MRKYILLLFVLTATTSLTYSTPLEIVEDCSNGIDDDGDGLIDCEDPDCDAYSDCIDPFPCTQEAYLFQYNDVYSVNLATGASTLEASAITEGNINAVGYNSVDQHIWGALTSPDKAIVRINNNFDTDIHIIEELPSTNCYVGDVDQNGIYYLKPGGSTFYRVNVNPNSLSYLQFEGSGELSANISIADWAFNPVDNELYSAVIGSNELIRINTSSGNITYLGEIPAMAGNNQAYGAVYFDNLGNMYVSANSSGIIYQVNTVHNVFSSSDIVSTIFAYGPASASNDGARCPQAEVPQEVCDNGIDDDGDGLIDCDDPSCSNFILCEGQEASGGNNGGLESNNRLSEQINSRNYLRAKNPNLVKNTASQMYKITKSEIQNRNEVGVERFLPSDILSAQAYESSPAELVEFTNAEDIYSLDYFKYDERIASIIALVSKDYVYEHTKYICDRLNGAEILDIHELMLDGKNNFLVAKFINVEGQIEYATSFAFYEEEGSFKLESHWNLMHYTPAPEYNTFQIWASKITDLTILANAVLEKIAGEKEITSYFFTGAPEVFVKKGRYQNNRLYFTVKNLNRSSTLTLFSERKLTETSTAEDVNISLVMDRFIEEQELEVNTGGLFDFGALIRTEKGGIPDGLYLSDGAWGIDEQASDVILSKEIISSEHDDNSAFWIERNIQVEAIVENKLSVYRSFAPSFRSINVNDFDALSFTAMGKGMMEITLVKEGEENWLNNPRTSIQLSEEKKSYDLVKEIFYSDNPETNNWDNLKMMVISVSPKSIDGEVSLDLSDISFRNGDFQSPGNNLSDSESTIFPNPVDDQAQIVFKSSEYQSYRIEFVDSKGEIKLQDSGTVAKGQNQILIQLSSLPSGIYYYRLILDSGKVINKSFYKL